MKLTKAEITELKNIFFEAVHIDNPSRGEGKIIDWIKKKIKPLNIGLIVDKKQNLFFSLGGEGETVLLNAHLDSVQPCINKKPRFDGKTFSSNGDTVLSADGLSGVVSILYAIFVLKKHKIPHCPIEVLFTAMEEIGGEGIKNFNFSQMKAKTGIVVDSIFSVGSIVMKSPSKYNFTVTAKGKAIHGSQVTKGISAIKMVADFLHRLPVGEVKPKTFINVGKIEGGNAVNTVPGEVQLEGSIKVSAEGEIRAETSKRYLEIVDLIIEKIKKTEKNYPKGKIYFSHTLKRGGYSFYSQDPLIKYVKAAIKSSGITPKETESFGVSDTNTLNSMGVKCVLIGTGVKNAHTTDETFDLKDLVKLTEIIIHFCRVGHVDQ